MIYSNNGIDIENGKDAYDYFSLEKREFSGYRTHFHRNPELYCICKGKLKITIDSATYTLTEGDAVFIRGMKIYSYEGSDAEVINAVIGTKYLQTFHEIYVNRVLPAFLGNKEVNKDLFSYLEVAGQLQEEFSPLKRYACVYTILDFIVENYGTVAPVSTKKTRADLSDIIQYIYNNSTQNISLSSLAEKFNYNPLSLSHMFSKYLKMDIRNFINNLRIQNYLELKSKPENKDKSVTEIAMLCGFNSSATFYRAFNKYTENAEE